MDVSKKAFSQFLEIPNAKFIIPVYQRNYGVATKTALPAIARRC